MNEHDILCPTKEESLPCDLCAFIREIRDAQQKEDNIEWTARLIEASRVLMDANIKAYKALYQAKISDE